MSPRPYPLRHVMCEKCGNKCISERKDRDICHKCYLDEPVARCKRCGQMRHIIKEESELCFRCFSRPEATCAKCLRTTTIYNQKEQLCKKCNSNLLRVMREKERRQIKVECSVCGKMRPSYLSTQAICRGCCEARNGRKHCAKCGKLKLIAKLSEGICKQCYNAALAPTSLKKYIEEFTTEYLYNTFLFNLLAANINWEFVTPKINQQFRVFGRFLQAQPTGQPLTWEIIDNLLPELGPTNRTIPKLIRVSLLDLGHLLAATGALESRDVYIARRNALLPIQHVPRDVQSLLQRYTAWLWERQTVPANVRDHLEALASFWSWCDQDGIHSPGEVNSFHIKNYLMTLYWQWQCSACQKLTSFDPRHPQVPKVCSYCGAVRSIIKVARYAQNTVRGQRAKLFVFFEWAKINRLVITNPVKHKTPAPSPTITHYNRDVIERLCEYIVSPKADPVEALMLYLIILHAFSVWELRYAEIPIYTLHKGSPFLRLTETYSVIVPQSAASLGNCSPGRPYVQLDFPSNALNWLRPLLERFESLRTQTVKNDQNRYLFFAPNKTRHCTPVSSFYIWKTVRQASLGVLGAACNPVTLKKTAGIIFADTAGAGILRWMGWSDQQAFAYTWAARQTVHPLLEDGSGQMKPRFGTDILIKFPSE